MRILAYYAQNEPSNGKKRWLHLTRTGQTHTLHNNLSLYQTINLRTH